MKSRSTARWLVDTNLLVLLVVGNVNPARIATCKRTSGYSEEDFGLLSRLLSGKQLWTLPHVMAEVSNLSDLKGAERANARLALRELISLSQEVFLSSARASQHQAFESIGLTDAAILEAAAEHRIAILTADVELFAWAGKQNIAAYNFVHERAKAGLL